jgi:hypothetical protein
MSMNNNSDNSLVNLTKAEFPYNVLSYLTQEEQVRLSRTCKHLYANTNSFWKTHPLNPIWNGEPIELKVVFCKTEKVELTVNCLYDQQDNQSTMTIRASQGLLTRGNIKYNIWDASCNPRFISLLPTYTKNAQIVLLCYNKTEDLARVRELYDIVKATQPDTKIILVCTDHKNLCSKQLNTFLTGKSIFRCCNFENPAQLQNEVNRVGFQIAKEKEQQKSSNENTAQQQQYDAFCSVQ